MLCRVQTVWRNLLPKLQAHFDAPIKDDLWMSYAYHEARDYPLAFQYHLRPDGEEAEEPVADDDDEQWADVDGVGEDVALGLDE